MTERAYAVNRVDERAGSSILRIEGRLVFAEAASLWGDLRKNTDSVAAGQSLHFDMSNVHAIDGGSMALLVQLRSDLHHRGATSEFVGAGSQVQEIIQLYHGDVTVGPRKKRRPKGTLAQIGDATLRVLTTTTPRSTPSPDVPPRTAGVAP